MKENYLLIKQNGFHKNQLNVSCANPPLDENHQADYLTTQFNNLCSISKIC